MYRRGTRKSSRKGQGVYAGAFAGSRSMSRGRGGAVMDGGVEYMGLEYDEGYRPKYGSKRVSAWTVFLKKFRDQHREIIGQKPDGSPVYRNEVGYEGANMMRKAGEAYRTNNTGTSVAHLRYVEDEPLRQQAYESRGLKYKPRHDPAQPRVKKDISTNPWLMFLKQFRADHTRVVINQKGEEVRIPISARYKGKNMMKEASDAYKQSEIYQEYQAEKMGERIASQGIRAAKNELLGPFTKSGKPRAMSRKQPVRTKLTTLQKLKLDTLNDKQIDGYKLTAKEARDFERLAAKHNSYRGIPQPVFEEELEMKYQ